MGECACHGMRRPCRCHLRRRLAEQSVLATGDNTHHTPHTTHVATAEKTDNDKQLIEVGRPRGSFGHVSKMSRKEKGFRFEREQSPLDTFLDTQ